MRISTTCKELCLIAIDSGTLHIYVNEESCTLTELLRRYRARVIDLQRLPLSVGDLSLSIVYNPSLSCLLLFFDHPFRIFSFTCLLSFFHYCCQSVICRYPLCTIHPCLLSRYFLTIPIFPFIMTCLLPFFYYCYE